MLIDLIFQTASKIIWRPSENLLCNNDGVMWVHVAKVLGECGVSAITANSTESRPGIAQIAIIQGGLGLMMSTLMITAPLLVGNLIGSSLGFNAYSPFGNGGARDSDGRLVEQRDRNKKDDGSTIIK
ncbi:hypothetical protein [Neisseria sp. oral taxon 014]|uniref:hypothetical protein n=1 Tax=Neisseria sp. oral taxon 014 TaxID=641148 RepID=UPI00110BF689|nr:hypothetical protein [Neisseria sp. oral taxon 014]